MGVTGRGILKAIVEGVESAERLSWKARGRLRKKEAELGESLRGDCSEFFRQTLEMHLKYYEFLTAQVADLEDRIRQKMTPYQAQVALLKTIPGVDEVVAWSLLAEMGADMSVFPTAAHVSSWAGLCPGENEPRPHGGAPAGSSGAVGILGFVGIGGGPIRIGERPHRTAQAKARPTSKIPCARTAKSRAPTT